MKKFELLAASAIALFYTNPALAQQAPPAQSAVQDNGADQNTSDDIVVTAQRTSERLQDVPISVSAFTGKALETQQIHNSLDLQLSLPNITYTKTNFTASSFTIRGIGDLCTGFSCDAATGIHINDVPVPATRLFETEYLDMERVEVLRGPQGTLFGRNATSGVVNFITARPDLTGIHASGSAEYGNYNSKKVTGVLNVPIGDTLGVRFAGLYLDRDGYTTNTFDNSQIDGRKLYQVRGSIRWQPSSSTTVDLMGSYFREDDNRSRIQKQLCHRDPTGILGCSPDRLGFDSVNSNAVFQDILTSREFFTIALSPSLAPFAVRSLYGADGFNGIAVPIDLRTVNSNVKPTYFSDEINIQGRIDQDFGQMSLSVIGGYNRSSVDSTAGYFLNTPNSLAANVGLNTFLGAASLPGSPFATGRALAFNSAGQLCTSAVDRSYTGVFGGHTYGCSSSPLNYDESRSKSEGWSAEAHLNSHFDGMFNFLIGGIYLTGITDGDYYVSPGLGSYAADIIGYAKGLGAGLPAGTTYLAPGFFNSETQRYQLKSYGIFGETYFQFSPKWKLTIGARYSHDQKFVTDRSPLLSVLVPYGTANAFSSPFAGAYDADAGTAGAQQYRNATVQFGRVTGRVVLDYKPSDNSMIYLSYSRGYKSGGINPPFDPSVFTAPATFKPESIDAFELGTKNTFMNGALRLNASVFYYKYKDLQLSRILNKTSFNDNTNADIYGAEVEAIIRPERHFMVNLSASYLKTKIKDFSLVDTRDPSGGRSDTVIIKDITNASNCVVRPTGNGTAAQANAFVNIVNTNAFHLQGPTPVPGTNTTGAYSICSTLATLIAGQVPNTPATAGLYGLQTALRGALGLPAGSVLPFQYTTTSAGVANGLPDGVAVDLSGNQLPNAPTWKFSAGAQHTMDIGSNGMTLVTRGDLTYTGEYFSRSFNRPIDKIQGYEVVNLSMTLNGPDEKWYLRGFVQNLTANNAITGQYVTDASTGLFTNIFTLEPRRYGVSAGFKF
ncbi:TonB-dependent receptor [Sphingomonas oligophenolica]|uniref:TonB-dependent receptor n=1 Tax=Sphingomonas oligophenolica TaxID=301154 RepID=A0ABU9XXC5_9SPHN